ncbi:MAG: hypothetical protein HQL39_20080 [Alphaproteobacteria bacterium]|nr:hypothetical protein [Alphaproteobacteria bacterium]
MNDIAKKADFPSIAASAEALDLTDLKSRVEENSRMIASLIAARVAEAIQPR